MGTRLRRQAGSVQSLPSPEPPEPLWGIVSGIRFEDTGQVRIGNKIEAFRRKTNCRKSLVFTMITTYGVKNNNKFSGIVNSQVTLEDLFRDPS